MTNTITILVPVAKAKIQDFAMAPRVQELDKNRIGFLWNKKPNGDILLNEIKEQLSQRFHPAGIKWFEHHISTPIETSMLDEIARSCDIVVNAVAD